MGMVGLVQTDKQTAAFSNLFAIKKKSLSFESFENFHVLSSWRPGVPDCLKYGTMGDVLEDTGDRLCGRSPAGQVDHV
jgi:hypothetical protein